MNNSPTRRFRRLLAAATAVAGVGLMALPASADRGSRYAGGASPVGAVGGSAGGPRQVGDSSSGPRPIGATSVRGPSPARSRPSASSPLSSGRFGASMPRPAAAPSRVESPSRSAIGRLGEVGGTRGTIRPGRAVGSGLRPAGVSRFDAGDARGSDTNFSRGRYTIDRDARQGITSRSDGVRFGSTLDRGRRYDGGDLDVRRGVRNYRDYDGYRYGYGGISGNAYRGGRLGASFGYSGGYSTGYDNARYRSLDLGVGYGSGYAYSPYVGGAYGSGGYGVPYYDSYFGGYGSRYLAPYYDGGYSAFRPRLYCPPVYYGGAYYGSTYGYGSSYVTPYSNAYGRTGASPYRGVARYGPTYYAPTYGSSGAAYSSGGSYYGGGVGARGSYRYSTQRYRY